MWAYVIGGYAGWILLKVLATSCLITMAANYWESTQRRYWQFTRESLSEIRHALEDEDRNLVQQYPLPERRLYSIFFNQRMLELCLYSSHY